MLDEPKKLTLEQSEAFTQISKFLESKDKSRKMLLLQTHALILINSHPRNSVISFCR